MPIDQVIKKISDEGSFTSFHEAVTTKSHKMYFDIEHDNKKLSIWTIE